MNTIKLLGHNIAMSNSGLYKFAEVLATPKSQTHLEKIQNHINNETKFNLLAYAEIDEYAVENMKDYFDGGDDEDFAYGEWVFTTKFEMM